MGIAAVQWHLRDLFVVHDSTDARGAGLHLERYGFDGDLFVDRTDAQADIDGGVSIDLQDDTALHVPAETLLGDFQHIGTNRKIRKHITAVCSAAGGTYNAGRGLSRFNGGSRNGKAARVPNRAVNLRCLGQR